MKKFIPHRLVPVLLVAAAICALGAIGAFAAMNWLPGRANLDFQAYKPGPLPGGITVTRPPQIANVKNFDQQFKEVRYQTSSADVSIGEGKSSPSDYATRLFSCASQVTNSTCETYASPSGQAYSIQTSYSANPDGSNGQPFRQTVSWLKGSTLIWVDLQNDQVQKYSITAWGKAVDAFTPW